LELSDKVLHKISHIDFHVEAGLTATLFEAPNLLQGKLEIPPDHLTACQLENVPTVGNAAGNKVNFLDLTGQPTAPPQVDPGYLVLRFRRILIEFLKRGANISIIRSVV
jgi:hypothetical protein